VNITSLFPSSVRREENEIMIEEVSKEELKVGMASFQKDKSSRLEGWMVELFIGFYDMLEEELLKVVEDTKRSGKVLGGFNSTFISLIPRKDSPKYFDDFRPISLWNYIYKIIAKVIVIRVKKIFSESISKEQFGFLHGRQTREVIGIDQEGLHTTKTKRDNVMVMKKYLSKAYDRACSLSLILIFLHKILSKEVCILSKCKWLMLWL
jgi:hypothetical protein